MSMQTLFVTPDVRVKRDVSLDTTQLRVKAMLTNLNFTLKPKFLLICTQNTIIRSKKARVIQE